MSKKRKSLILIYAIIAVAFILLSLIIPFNKPGSSWIMFGFSIASIIAGLLITYYTYGKSKTLMSKFYGYPLFRIGLIYTGVQLTLTIILYIIGAFLNVPFWVGLLISVIVAVLAAIGCIVTNTAKDIIEEIDAKDHASTQKIAQFQICISEILTSCKDEEIRGPLSKLETKFRYSDPVSSPATIDKENEITQELENLKNLVKKGEKQDILNEIENISTMLSTRNKMCEISKP